MVIGQNVFEKLSLVQLSYCLSLLKKYNPQIAKLGFKIFNCLLYSSEQKLNLYSQSITGDSISYDQVIHKTVETLVVTTQALDSFVQSHNLVKPDFIKIDAQGSELEILKGSSTVLASTSLLYIEAPITSVNSGAPMAHSIIDFLKGLDFKVSSFNEHHYLPGQLAQIYILFGKAHIVDQLFQDLA